MEKIRNKAEYKLIAEAIDITFHAAPGTKEALLHKTYIRLIVSYLKNKLLGGNASAFRAAILGVCFFQNQLS